MSDTIDWAPRIRLAVVVVGLLVAVPLVIAGVLGGTTAAVGMAIGSAMTAAGTVSNGIPAGRVGIPALIVGVGVGSALAGTWWSVVLVAALAAAAGLASSVGATMPVMLGAVMASVVPGADAREAVVLALFTAIGCGYGIALVERCGLPTGEPLTHPLGPAALAAAFAGVAAVAASIATAIGDPRANWIPMTALIVAIPASTSTSSRSRERIAGTLLGAAIAIAIGVIGPPRVVYLAIAVASLLLVVATAGLRYRIQTTFITLVVLTGGGAPDQELTERRVVYTLVGAGVLAAGVAIVAAVWRPRRPTSSGR